MREEAQIRMRGAKESFSRVQEDRMLVGDDLGRLVSIDLSSGETLASLRVV
jgi:hypothetical protein